MAAEDGGSLLLKRHLHSASCLANPGQACAKKCLSVALYKLGGKRPSKRAGLLLSGIPRRSKMSAAKLSPGAKAATASGAAVVKNMAAVGVTKGAPAAANLSTSGAPVVANMAAASAIGAAGASPEAQNWFIQVLNKCFGSCDILPGIAPMPLMVLAKEEYAAPVPVPIISQTTNNSGSPILAYLLGAGSAAAIALLIYFLRRRRKMPETTETGCNTELEGELAFRKVRFDGSSTLLGAECDAIDGTIVGANTNNPTLSTKKGHHRSSVTTSRVTTEERISKQAGAPSDQKALTKENKLLATSGQNAEKQVSGQKLKKTSKSTETAHKSTQVFLCEKDYRARDTGVIMAEKTGLVQAEPNLAAKQNGAATSPANNKSEKLAASQETPTEGKAATEESPKTGKESCVDFNEIIDEKILYLSAQHIYFRRKDINTRDVTEVCKTDMVKVQNFESVLAKVTEDACKMASHIVETSGTTVKENPNRTADERLNYIQKDTEALRDSWLGLTRTLYCTNIHLNNAKQYQLFHYEVEQLQDALDALNSEVTDVMKTTENDVTKIQNNISSLQDTEKRLHSYGDWIERLCATSKIVHPVHMRTEPSEDPLPVLTLCKYETDTFCTESGEPVLLLDNSDTALWQCRLASGEEVHIPAVCIVIPPPDINTMKQVANLEATYKELNSRLRELYISQISVLAKYIVLEMNKRTIQSMSPEQQLELLQLVDKLEEYMNKYLTECPGLADNVKKLRQRVLQLIVLELVEKPDPEVEELLVLLRLWLALEQMYGRSTDAAARRRQLVQQGTLLDAEDTEWETLAEVVESRQQMAHISITMDTETAAISGNDTYEQSISESTTCFTVKGVKDTCSGKEMSMDEAIECGIIDPNNGLFQDLKTGQSYPIPVAINAGFITIENAHTEKSKELKHSVGVVTVEYTRETRPFTVTAVLDPNTQEHVDVDKAIKLGLINEETKAYTNTRKGETMSLADAVDSGALLVEYDTEAEVNSKPEVTCKTFAISWVLDRANGKRLTFDDAVEAGLVVKEKGLYHDTVSKENLPLVDAMKKQYVRGRVVTDPTAIDRYMTRMRSTSIDSQDSDRLSDRLSDGEL